MASPPSLARLLLGLVADRDARRDMLGDAQEEYEQQMRAHGPKTARSWYRWQVARSLWPLVVRRITRRHPTRSVSWAGRSSTFGQDLHYALRSLARAPAFTGVIVLTLALGVGANSAVFSLVHSLVIEPLPFPGGARVVKVWREERTEGDRPLLNPHPTMVAAWRQEARTLESFAAFTEDEFHLHGDLEPAAISGIRAAPELLTLIGARPRLGRLFTPDDAVPGMGRVVLLTEQFWATRFGSDPTLIGRSVVLDEISFKVVGVVAAPARGVLESGFFGAQSKEVIVPLAEDWDGGWRDGGPSVVARLAPGLTVADAQAELEAIQAHLPPLQSNGTEWHPLVQTPRDDLSRTLRTGLWMLLGAAGMVLLISCANAANLLLVRRLAREQELRVRLALGAGRLRLARLVAAESLILGGASLALALFMTRWVVDGAKWIAGSAVPEIQAARVEPSVFVFAGVLGLGTTLVFSLIPLRQAWLTCPSDVSKGRRMIGKSSRSGWRAHQSLVVAQVSLAMVLTLGTGLLSNSLGRLLAVDPGIDVTGLLAIGIDLPRARYDDREARIAFFEEAARQAERLPEVSVAGWGRAVPPRIFGALGAIAVEGRGADEVEELEPHAGNWVSPGYFRAVGAPILEGRAFSASDVSDRASVVILGRSTADRYWPGGGAIGSRVSLRSASGTSPWLTVVGVVPDVKAWWLGDRPDRIQVYLPVSDQMGRAGVLLVRTTGDPGLVIPLVRQQIRAVDGLLPIRETFTVADAFRQSVGNWRFQTLLISSFSALSLLLAVLGIYGVLALAVSRRTREIGVRLALGATRANITSVVVGQGMKAVMLGIGVGLVLSSFLSRYVTDLLWGIEVTDAATYVVAISFMGLIGLIASYVPTLRASVIDPVGALRSE